MAARRRHLVDAHDERVAEEEGEHSDGGVGQEGGPRQVTHAARDFNQRPRDARHRREHLRAPKCPPPPGGASVVSDRGARVVGEFGLNAQQP